MGTAYEETFDAWRREVHNPELQPLRTGFFKDLAGHLKRLRESLRNLDPKSLKAIIITEELQRLEQLAPQLIDLRIEKLWKQAGTIQSSSLDSSEQWMNDETSKTIHQHEKFKEDIVQGREPSSTPTKPKENLLLRFIREVPSIIGVDLKTHGPFLKEDVALLPYDNAESLIRQGAAVEIRSTQDNG
jgi:DNA replication factor GINS